jgi:hypothetical protein
MEYHVDPGELCFYNILKRANLTLDVIVTVLREYDPGDKTPCVTFYSAGPTGDEISIPYYIKTSLPENHPYYDPENPDEQYVTKFGLRTTIPGSITLHIWADSKPEKDSLIYQVRKALKKAMMNDYYQCSNYDYNTDKCKTTKNTCDAIDSLGNVCPYESIIDINDPNYRNPSNALVDSDVHGLIIQTPQSIDELGVIPEVYHSSILITYNRYEYYMRDTAPLCAFEDDSEGETL